MKKKSLRRGVERDRPARTIIQNKLRGLLFLGAERSEKTRSWEKKVIRTAGESSGGKREGTEKIAQE